MEKKYKHKKTLEIPVLMKSPLTVPLKDEELQSIKQSTAEAKAYLMKAFLRS